MTREILLIIIAMVLISLNTSVFETHAQSHAQSQAQDAAIANGGAGGLAKATLYCGGPQSCKTVVVESNGGPGGNAISNSILCVKGTGQELLDVVTLPYGAPVSQDTISTKIIKIPNDVTSRVRLAVTNTGDAVYNLTAKVFPSGINGLTPSAISSPNIPGIAGHSNFFLGEIPANGIKEFDVNVSPTHKGTVELPVQLTYSNAVGTNTPSSTVCRQITAHVSVSVSK